MISAKVEIGCDNHKCDEYKTYTHSDMVVIESHLKELGWHVNGKVRICPDCKNAYMEIMKSLRGTDQYKEPQANRSNSNESK